MLYGSFYYGGLYQNISSIFIGILLSIIISFVVFLKYSLADFLSFINIKSLFLILISLYIFLASWTLYNSPRPRVDTYFQFLEAPQKVLKGENPYTAVYTKVYKNIEHNYFMYLPFSIIYAIPFNLFFFDPRFGIVFANVISSYFMYLFFRSKHKEKIAPLFISTFLLLPRSFYILEHMYLDPIIFMFFLLCMYCFYKKRHSLAILTLSLFFSFKQHLLLLLPLFIKTKFKNFLSRRNLILSFIPFLFPIYFFFLNPSAFLNNVFFNFSPNKNPSPISISLSLPTLLKHIPLMNQTHLWLIIPLIIFLTAYVFILGQSGSLKFKILFVLFTLTLISFQSFYNHYYLVAQFLFFDIMVEYLKIKV